MLYKILYEKESFREGALFNYKQKNNKIFKNKLNVNNNLQKTSCRI